jgi:hypothetical protein
MRSIMRPLLLLAMLLPFSVAVTTLADDKEIAKFPPLPPPADPAALGVGIQRTMTKLATSTPERRNTVKVLFYGQSITEQTWSRTVAEDLHKRFPHANLIIENRAIGGFASQRLIKPAEHDLYSFYPDLLIFHVYGANQEYEQIIRNVRTRTTAEVLMQLDHVAAGGWQDQPDQKADKGLWWDWMMNHELLPGIARKYGCAMLDVRTPWIDYLKVNNYKPQQLLKDGVHLNAQGNYVLAEIVKRYLVYRPELATLPQTMAANKAIQTVEVGKDVEWKDGKLELAFDGNRIDAIAAAAGGSGKAQVLIDGKRPNEIPGCYAITRPQPGPFSPLWVYRIDHDVPFTEEEEWTLTIKSFDLNGGGTGIVYDSDSAMWTYEVTGSKTGPDGTGQSDRPFMSNSRKVKIEPKTWLRNGKVAEGYQIKWKVILMGTDGYEPMPVNDATVENTAILAQGLENGKHTLILSGDVAALKALRVYRPVSKD